jgi:hypothetical protein
MRLGLRIFLAIASSAAVLGTFSVSSQASCAAPDVRVARVAAPGVSLTVRGRFWATECNDVISCSVGCLGKQTCTGGGPSPPARNLQIVLVSVADRSRIDLASDVDASPRTLAVKHSVTLPVDLERGRYRVLMGSEAMGWYPSDVIRVRAGLGNE